MLGHCLIAQAGDELVEPVEDFLPSHVELAVAVPLENVGGFVGLGEEAAGPVAAQAEISGVIEPGGEGFALFEGVLSDVGEEGADAEEGCFAIGIAGDGIEERDDVGDVPVSGEGEVDEPVRWVGAAFDLSISPGDDGGGVDDAEAQAGGEDGGGGGVGE